MYDNEEIRDRIDELREAVVDIQAKLKMYQYEGFPEKTLLILLQHSTKLPMKTIKAVLDGLESLYDDYLTDGPES